MHSTFKGATQIAVRDPNDKHYRSVNLRTLCEVLLFLVLDIMLASLLSFHIAAINHTRLFLLVIMPISTKTTS